MSTVTTRPIGLAITVSHAFGDAGAMVARELRRTVRSVDSLVTALVIPVSIMLVFVIVFGGAIEGNGDYINYVVPGTLVLCVGFVSASTAVAVAQDMTSGTIDRFKTLPIFAASPMIGHVVSSVIRNLATTAVVIGVALLLGFRPHADLGGWLAAVGFLVLAILGFTWISCAAGLALSVEAAGSVNFVFLFLPYLSSGFVPIDSMPDWLQGFARTQPFTPIIETARGLLSGTDVGGTGWSAVAWIVGFIVVGYAASVLLYRRTAR
ncbi:ABC transporter permease [Lacisediminihabitans sp.]|uniref:ABC transporter permease n=1 Tax=Lacisediminihabitans sp. TaxID=2787631 RepID=UPI00374D36E1